ncbi:MAG: hypothetical protein H8D23_37535 [Candidatus Brocadiales bacterium]|nr:hypothetical protein [Candidatus Brocadiales bacterium]
MENKKILIHRLNNVLTLIESCINRLKNADVKTLNKKWFFMKDVVIATGRDRLDREIELYKKTENPTKKAFEETYNNVCKQLSEADGYYKDMFDLLDGPNGYSEENKNMILTNGNKLVGVLKDIMPKLSDVCPPVLNG